MSAPDPTPASALVLTNMHLLELILVALPPRDLLLAQRVSSTWRATITSSPSIQKALFFRADTSRRPNQRVINPLLEELFPPFFRQAENPENSYAERHHQPKDLGTLPLADPQRTAAFTRRGASWRRMLVQQPALERLGFVSGPVVWSDGMVEFPLRPTSGTGSSGSTAVAPKRGSGKSVKVPQSSPPSGDEGGLRMGALYDMIWGCSSAADPCSWRIMWQPDIPGEETTIDDTDDYYWLRNMGAKQGVRAAIGVLNFDDYQAKLWRLADRRMGDLTSEDIKKWKCDEFEEREVKTKVYFVAR